MNFSSYKKKLNKKYKILIVINREKINLIKLEVSQPWPDTAAVACIFPTHDGPSGSWREEQREI